jgi:ankyrin repeat protein
MSLFKPNVKKLIENCDFSGLTKLLSEYPNLANEGITIPFDIFCRKKAHPLHRICDAIFAGKISDYDAVKLVKVFLGNGAEIDGDKHKNEGTPLLAAASLHAEQVGIFYVDNGADVNYTYNNDGASALHWAAFCGRDKLVKRLIKANAKLDELDIEHKSTPLGWAIHALQSNDTGNKHNQLSCIKLLLKSGADLRKLDQVKNDYLRFMSTDDSELKKILN